MVRGRLQSGRLFSVAYYRYSVDAYTNWQDIRKDYYIMQALYGLKLYDHPSCKYRTIDFYLAVTTRTSNPCWTLAEKGRRDGPYGIASLSLYLSAASESPTYSSCRMGTLIDSLSRAHWYLIVVVNPVLLLEDVQPKDPEEDDDPLK